MLRFYYQVNLSLNQNVIIHFKYMNKSLRTISVVFSEIVSRFRVEIIFTLFNLNCIGDVLNTSLKALEKWTCEEKPRRGLKR